MHKSNVAAVQHARYTNGMSVALGGYIKTLRLRQGITQAALLRRLEKRFEKLPDRTKLYRVEKGEHWPDGDFLTALLDELGGRVPDVGWIQSHPKANEAQGVALAEQWLKERATPEAYRTIMEVAQGPDADEIATELEELARRVRGGHG